MWGGQQIKHFNTVRCHASEGQWNSQHISPQERRKERGKDIPLKVWCLYSPCFSLHIAYLCLSWSWRNGMAGSLLLLLPLGFSSLPLPTEVFTSASVWLRSPMAIGPMSLCLVLLDVKTFFRSFCFLYSSSG